MLQFKFDLYYLRYMLKYMRINIANKITDIYNHLLAGQIVNIII